MSRSSEMYSPHLIRINRDGTGIALLGGAELTVDEGNAQATRAHLIRLCIAYAQETQARTLIRLEDPDDPAEFIESDPSGTVRPIQLSPPATRDDLPDAPHEFEGAAPKQSRALNAHLRQANEPVSPLALLRGRKWVAPMVVIGAGLIVVFAIVGVLYATFSGGDGGGKGTDQVQVTQGAALPKPPPLEWKRDALWESPALLPEAQKVAVVDGDAVGMVTADRRVALVGDDAATRWTKELPEGEVRSALHLTMMGQTRVLAIHVGSRLVWWSTETGDAGGVDLPAEDAPISWRGDTPLIGTGPTSVAVMQDGKLAPVEVPKDARAVSGWPDGHVVAASSTGWWRLSPGQDAGAETAWQTPVATADELTVIDGMGSYIVTVEAIGEVVQTVIHQDTPKGVIRVMAGTVPGAKPGEALTWHPSPSREWGVLGHSIVDLSTASVTDIGSPFTLSHIAADRASGRLGEEDVIVWPGGPGGVLQAGESFPEEVLEAKALVRHTDANDEQRVYLLPPDPDVPNIKTGK